MGGGEDFGGSPNINNNAAAVVGSGGGVGTTLAH